MPDFHVQKVMDMMKIRIRFYPDLQNHTYFFEEPAYDLPQTRKFLRRLKQPTEVKIEILEDLITLFS